MMSALSLGAIVRSVCAPAVTQPAVTAGSATPPRATVAQICFFR